MSKKSYQIIEPEVLYLRENLSVHAALLYGILIWLVEQLRNCNDEKFNNIEFDVIRVEYVGKYPAIGIHYKNPDVSDVSEYVEEKIEHLLKTRSVMDFLASSLSKNEDWQNKLDALMRN